jgi:site-specific recombinase XerD
MKDCALNDEAHFLLFRERWQPAPTLPLEQYPMRSDQDEVILIKFEEALTQAALSSSTIVNYLADLRAFLRWGKQKIAREFSLLQVSQKHIRLYRSHLDQELKRAASTINRHLMALRKFYTFAQEIGFLAIDPTSGVSLISDQGQSSARSLSKEEIEKLLIAAQNGSRAGLVRRDLAILHLLLYTGLRVSEIVDLKKEDIIFDDPGVILQVGPNQHETQARYLPLSSEVCKVLHHYLLVRPQTAATEHFFLSQEGRPLSKRTVQRIVSDCAKAAGLEGVSAQSMRRTFALQLFSNTDDLALVSKRLGHQTVSITEQYLSIHEGR